MNNTLLLIIILKTIEYRNHAQQLEFAFRRIRDATGVADVSEVVAKFIAQDGVQARLKSLVQEQQVSTQ